MPSRFCRTGRLVFATVALSVAGSVSTASAQRFGVFAGGTAFRIADGGDPWDFRTTLTGGAGVGWSIRFLRLDLTLTYLSYVGTEFSTRERRTHLLPEFGVYVQPRAGRVRPYVGPGAGLALQLQGWYQFVELSLHAAAGADVTLPGSWDARLELRSRGIVPFGETHSVNIGLTRRL